jgi:hypothetical protein
MLRFLKHPRTPLLLLLSLNLAAGLLTFRSYGLSWDEPLFYNYADSIWKAYTPQAFSPDFDFDSVYGRSAEDHKYYGPAYLLLARPVEQALSSLFRIDQASAWHLVNFITFQLGLIGFYRLARRWHNPWPAAAATAFLAWQPVFWGHAFINPKDAPFMAAFLWALTLGLELVDRLTAPEKDPRLPLALASASLLLGLTSAIRVIGPLAGLLTSLYFLSRLPRRGWVGFGLYGLTAAAVMFIFWPFLWAAPIPRLLEVLKHMSNNPTELAVLFDGQIFRANAMPRRYLPQMLAIALTEPTWILFGVGLIVVTRNFIQKQLDPRPLLVVFGLFLGMLAYLVYFIPAMYDGFRHFLFILPPAFLGMGFAFQWLWEQNRPRLFALVALLLLFPGVAGIVKMHPYEYAYYNAFTGGTGGAFRVYETEYWLTCYREAIQWVKANEPATTLHVQREMDLAAYYSQGLSLKDLGKENESDLQPGDLVLFHTRANLDIRSTFRNLPVVTTIGRDGAAFCLIKRKE